MSEAMEADEARAEPAYKRGTDEQRVVSVVQMNRHEAYHSRRFRILQNDLNFDFYHLRQGSVGKQNGQSDEFLPKLAMATEQVTSFLHQGLMDVGEWFSVEAARGNKQPLFTDSEMTALLDYWLEQAGFYTHSQDAIKAALLGALMITKVTTKKELRPTYTAKRNKTLLGYQSVLEMQRSYETQLHHILVRQRDYFPDPTGRKLYQIEQIELDYFELLDLAKDNPDDYNVGEVERLKGSLVAGPDLDERRRSRETGQAPDMQENRMRVRLHEFWGTLVDERGELIRRNCVCTVANDRYLIRKPQDNPYWHQRSPYVVTPIIRAPWSEWHKALMDAPMMLNRAANELFNLTLDSGLRAVFGVQQVRTHWLSNPDQLSGGIRPNQVVQAGPQCPPGQKAVETVSTSTGGASEALEAQNMVSSEFNAASMTTDLKMGVLPSRSVKATEVVESQNSITGTFSTIAKAVEHDHIEKVLELSALTMMQEVKTFDTPEYRALLGDDRAEALGRLGREKRFALVVRGHSYKVFGLTQTLNKIKDFRKLTTLLQTIGGNPQLMDEFQKRFSIAKLLQVIMKALDIDEDQIKLDEVDELMGQVQGQQPGGAQPGQSGQQPAQQQQQPSTPPMATPNVNSQTPQMSASGPEMQLAGADKLQMPQGGNA